jgi:gamma-glutamyltranspeptidase/glutathione hydrolase
VKARARPSTRQGRGPWNPGHLGRALAFLPDSVYFTRLTLPIRPLRPRSVQGVAGAVVHSVNDPARFNTLRFCLALTVSLSVSGCGAVKAVKTTVLGADESGPKILGGFIGGAVADEPRAALAAKQILALGGNAADAAVTLGLMLAVTLPSRASLGGGGACVAYQPGASTPNKGVPEAILFIPPAPAQRAGDRPAAVPMLARGLYLLAARYGTEQFAQLVAPAEQAARFGFPVSRALAVDLASVAGPLTADPSAAAIFAPGGVPLTEGGRLQQSDLGGTLAQIRTVGVGDMYEGLLGHKLAEATAASGGPITVSDLRNARPALAPVLSRDAGHDHIAFLPLPADGGVAAAAAFGVLAHDPSAMQAAGAASEAVAARFRAQGGDAGTLLSQGGTAPGLPALPASTSFVVVDRKGGAVACSLTLNNLFGTGRVAPGTGILLAASPAVKPPPLLGAAIVWNENIHAFKAAIGGSGQNAAGLAVASVLAQAETSGGMSPVPDPGRANAVICAHYLPGEPQSCQFSTDPRGSGLASGGSQ